jgi:hypothetical protein
MIYTFSVFNLDVDNLTIGSLDVNEELQIQILIEENR